MEELDVQFLQLIRPDGELWDGLIREDERVSTFVDQGKCPPARRRRDPILEVKCQPVLAYGVQPEEERHFDRDDGSVQLHSFTVSQGDVQEHGFRARTHPLAERELFDHLLDLRGLVEKGREQPPLV